MKTTKFIIITLLVLSVAGLLFGIYLLVRNMDIFKGEQTASDIVQAPKDPKKGDVGYVETNKNVPVDETSRYAGKYEYVVDGELFLEVGGKSISYKLNDDLLVLNCTTQSLANAKAADTKLVTQVKTTDRTSVGLGLKEGEPLFILTAQEGERQFIHTIFLSTTACQAF